MKRLGTGRGHAGLPRARADSVPGAACAAAAAALGALAAVAAVVDAAAGEPRPAAVFAATAAALGSGAWWGARRWRLGGRLVPRVAFAGVVGAFALLVAATALAYVVAGALHPGDAVIESANGYATSAVTVVEHPGTLSPGTRVLRAGTQWVGGFAALVVVVAVLPSLGLGLLRSNSDVSSPVTERIGSHQARRVRRGLARSYLALTACGVALYLVGGLGPLDAVCLAFTTISTGGFTNAEPGEAFATDRLQWVAIGGMVLAGSNLALWWRGIRPAAGEAAANHELRTYAVGIAGATALLAVLEADGALHLDGLRRALFTVTSTLSTTGFAVGPWDGGGALAGVVVVVLIGVGAMSGSPGGGFRVVRARVLVAFVGSVVRREEHPRAVVPVRLGSAVVADEVTRSMVGFQVLWIGCALVGAVALGAAGVDAAGAVSGAVSALATVGPALGDLAPANGVPDSGAAAVLAALAIVGRLGIYPLTALRRPARGR